VDVATAIGTLLTTAGRDDPYPIYQALRGHGSVAEAGGGFYVVTGYEAADQALRDPAMLVPDASYLDRVAPDWRESRSVRSIGASMLNTNPPDHGRMRRLVSGTFTARRVAALRQTVQERAAALADRIAEEQRPVDFMAEFAYPLPVQVISALLGVPDGDQAEFRRRATDLTTVLELSVGGQDLRAADRATAELEEYFTDLVARRRREPRDDLTTALARQDGPLTPAELLANLILLLVAGFETTTNLLGNGLVALLRCPGAAARLREDPTLAPAVVQEVLRFDSPVQLTSRWCPEPAEVGGRRLPAYSQILILLGAANRDPRRFPRPEVFDPTRAQVAAPLSFGAGAHFCLGAALARLEAQVALPLLLRRLPGLALAGDPVRRDRLVLRGYARLPVVAG
jgi:cytochrome P450